MTDELKETKTGALQTLDNKKFKLIETLRLKIVDARHQFLYVFLGSSL